MNITCGQQSQYTLQVVSNHNKHYRWSGITNITDAQQSQ